MGEASRRFYFMHRGWMDVPALASGREPFCRRAAWVWLIEEAAWDDRKVNISGRTVTLQRGQVGHSLRFMAEAWGWSLGGVQRFIERLKTDTMVNTSSDTGQTIISICNYDKYQARPGFYDTESDTPSNTEAIQGRYSSDTNENQVNNLSKDSFPRNAPVEPSMQPALALTEPAAPPPAKGRRATGDAEFDAFWTAYPKKTGKLEAQRQFAAARKTASAADIMAGLARYRPDPRYVLDPERWLKRGRWMDETAAAAPPPQAAPAHPPTSRPRTAAGVVLDLDDLAESGL